MPPSSDSAAGSPPPRPPDSARVAGAVARLRSAGERVTPARYAVLRVIDAADLADEHLTAEHVGSRVAEIEPSVHRATVYRTLTSLVDTGVLAHVHLGGAATVYHLAEGVDPDERTPEQHHEPGHAHVQCHVCGRVLDVAPDVFDGVAARLRKELGFVLDTRHAALLGTCHTCSTATTPATISTPATPTPSPDT